MDLIFITEARFIQLDDGRVYSLESSFSYPLFKRYLQHFDNVILFARVKNGHLKDVIETNLVSKENVKVVALPYYVGFNEFIKQFLNLRKRLQYNLVQHLGENTCVICRIPGRIGSMAIACLKKVKKPYGIEVVGDPYDVLSNGATRHPLRKLIRFFSFNSLKKSAREAPAALYVTKYKLQERYPCPNFSIGVSDVALTEEAFVKYPRQLLSKKPLKIICVGTLEQMYKAPDIMLHSLKILIDSGLDCVLTWVGSGKYKAEMELLADKLGIAGCVRFTGKLSSGNKVREELDQADIYVMASRMEGLPRAMVEAMARALPCIGTKICGIPELISPECLVPVNDPEVLAEKILFLSKNPAYATEQACRNLAEAKNYREELLEVERKKFYDYLKRLG